MTSTRNDKKIWVRIQNQYVKKTKRIRMNVEIMN